MISNIQSRNTFTGRPPKLKKVLPKTKQILSEYFAEIKSPSRCRFLTPEEFASKEAEIKELNNRFGFVKNFINTLYKDGGIPEHFRGLIGIVEAFKVGNCEQFSEIAKTLLKMNKVKKADMYAMYAKKLNSHEAPRSLNHSIVAINVPKSKNNKLTRKPFIPSKKVIGVDMWLDGYIGKVSESREVYKELGLLNDEVIMLRPLLTLEPNQAAFDAIKADFPKMCKL